MVELIVMVILSVIFYKILGNKKTSMKKSFHKPYTDTWKKNEREVYNAYAERKAIDENYRKIKEKRKQQDKEYAKQYEDAVGHLLSTKYIAEHFKLTQKNMNKIFEELHWIEISGQWVLTKVKGNFNGARQKYNAQTKRKYVLWEDDVLENEELLKKVACQFRYARDKSTTTTTSYKEKVLKGKEYEEFVAKIYRSRGYHVTEYGKIKGKEDHGIDLIAKKEKEIVLIQCKNWKENGKWKIKHKDIKAFQTDARTFVEDKPLLRSCLLTARYTISGDFIHSSAINHIEEMKKLGKRVDYEIVKIV